MPARSRSQAFHCEGRGEVRAQLGERRGARLWQPRVLRGREALSEPGDGSGIAKTRWRLCDRAHGVHGPLFSEPRGKPTQAGEILGATATPVSAVSGVSSDPQLL